MNHEALFAATYFLGKENFTGDEWVYPGFVTYQPDYMLELARKHGLACKPLDWSHPSGQQLLIFFHSDYEPVLPTTLNMQRLVELQNRLEALETDPYVKLGRKLHNLLGGVFPKR